MDDVNFHWNEDASRSNAEESVVSLLEGSAYKIGSPFSCSRASSFVSLLTDLIYSPILVNSSLASQLGPSLPSISEIFDCSKIYSGTIIS